MDEHLEGQALQTARWSFTKTDDLFVMADRRCGDSAIGKIKLKRLQVDN